MATHKGVASNPKTLISWLKQVDSIKDIILGAAA
jgi:hypothetical protein